MDNLSLQMKLIPTSEAMWVTKILLFRYQHTPTMSHYLVHATRPFFFDNNQDGAVTSNGERDRAVLNKCLFPKIEENDIDGICFQ